MYVTTLEEGETHEVDFRVLLAIRDYDIEEVVFQVVLEMRAESLAVED